jgi:uncharacterized damage-inducible protein DinB
MKKLLASSLLILITISSYAQLADSIKAQFIKDWQRAKAYTKEYLDAMPKDKFSFKAQDSVMLHMAQGTISLMSAGSGKKVPAIINRRNLEQTESAWSSDSITYFVNLSYDFAIEAIQEFDMSKAYERVKRGNFDESRLAWIMKSFEHQTHHRGQTTIYIRLVGIKPPNEKLF